MQYDVGHPVCIFYIVYCILYIVYCILYIVYCILYIVYCILYIVYCIHGKVQDPIIIQPDTLDQVT